MIEKRVNLNARRAILPATCFSKCYLKHLGKRDGKNEIPYIVEGVDKNSLTDIKTPTIIREEERIKKCLSVLTERLNKKNNALYKDIMVSIVEFEQAALDYDRLHKRLEDKLKEYDIIIPKSYSTQQEEDFLSAKRDSESNLDEFGVRTRRFNEYQSKLSPMRKELFESRKKLIDQYKNIVSSIEQLKNLEDCIANAVEYYSAKVNKRISWYWQGVLLKHEDKDTLPSFPKEQLNSQFECIFKHRRKEFEDKLEELKKIHNDVLSMPEL